MEPIAHGRGLPLVRVLDIFSGIGGMSLGLESVGMRTVAFCEVDPFCRAVLEHHWPGVPIHDDVRTLRGSDVGAVDLVAGGFPCQPVSVAGKRKGQADARWLWPEMLRLVRALRPRWVLAENVPGLRTLGADRVLEDLESEGYSCWPLVVGADDLGAPHRRKRVWIVAYCDSEGRGPERSSGLLDGERQAPRDDADGRGVRTVGDSLGAGLAVRPSERGHTCAEQPSAERASGPRWPARPGEPQHEWEEPRLAYTAAGGRDAQPLRSASAPARNRAADADAAGAAGAGGGSGSPELPMGGPVDGLPERLVRRANREALRALGNAVVPQVVAQIGLAILAAEAVTVGACQGRTA